MAYVYLSMLELEKEVKSEPRWSLGEMLPSPKTYIL